MIRLSPHMQRALLACETTPERLFLDIAEEHGVDREELQEVWFDLINARRAPHACQSLPIEPRRIAAHG